MRLCKVLAPLAVAVLTTPAFGAAPDLGSGKEQAGIAYASVAAALEAVRAKPGVLLTERSGWVVVRDDAESTFWSFPPASHPAYPAVVKRVVYERAGSLFLSTGIKCEATKPACDALAQDFAASDEQIRKEFKAKESR